MVVIVRRKSSWRRKRTRFLFSALTCMSVSVLLIYFYVMIKWKTSQGENSASVTTLETIGNMKTMMEDIGKKGRIRALRGMKTSDEGALDDFKIYWNKKIAFRHKWGEKTLRETFEETHPMEDTERTKRVVTSLRFPGPGTRTDDIPYDVRDCPLSPGPDYPMSWNVLDVLDHWNVDDSDITSTPIYHGLCIFDMERDTDKINGYRELEVPFIIQNYTEVQRTAERWMSSPEYLKNLIGDETMRTEYSKNNHFMYWKTPKISLLDWEPPTDNIQLPYEEWLENAEQLQRSTVDQTTQEHWYFRLNGLYKKASYLYDELPYFNPLHESPLLIEPKENRGINCRFGMKGVIAEAHFDSSRNFIVLMGGQRRYILAHPDQCTNMELYPKDHPSGRHSRVNWSSRDLRDSDRPFAHARVNEVVLQAGDILYLPTGWFHFIVSMNINFQCNARSGSTQTYAKPLKSCGMKMKST